MIKRYQTKEMQEIWSEENKIKTWLNVELAVCKNSIISDDHYKKISKISTPTPEEVLEVEKELKHDLASFVYVCRNKINDVAAANCFHRGLTSSDVIDTANTIMIKESLNIIYENLKIFQGILREKSLEYKNLICIGRTHGMHAEPTSFGLKFLGWYSEAQRNCERIINAIDEMSYGKLSGPVGNYSNIDPGLEDSALFDLGLKVEPVSTQIIPRDRYAQMFSVLSLIGNMIERIALEIRSLQRSEINEVEEYFSEKQMGSSVMAHKHNPISSEQLMGIARIIRSNMNAAFENTALWHERDISNSSVERIILPDTFHLVHYSLNKISDIITNLVVKEDNIKNNLQMSIDVCSSQKILNYLMDLGIDRQKAYEIIKIATEFKYDFIGTIVELTETKGGIKIENEDLEKVISFIDLKNIDVIYERVLL